MTTIESLLIDIKRRAETLSEHSLRGLKNCSNEHLDVTSVLCILVASLKEAEKALTKVDRTFATELVEKESTLVKEFNRTKKLVLNSSGKETSMAQVAAINLSSSSINELRNEMRILRKKVSTLLSSEELLSHICEKRSVLSEEEQCSNNDFNNEHKREHAAVVDCEIQNQELQEHLEKYESVQKEDELISNKRQKTENSIDISNSSHSQEEIDLGQYSRSDVFDSNPKKKERFAKLMGGAKRSIDKCSTKNNSNRNSNNHNNNNSKTLHSTHAVSSSCITNINNELANQFNAALTHKGKKGLGAEEPRY